MLASRLHVCSQLALQNTNLQRPQSHWAESVMFMISVADFHWNNSITEIARKQTPSLTVWVTPVTCDQLQCERRHSLLHSPAYSFTKWNQSMVHQFSRMLEPYQAEFWGPSELTAVQIGNSNGLLRNRRPLPFANTEKPCGKMVHGWTASKEQLVLALYTETWCRDAFLSQVRSPLHCRAQNGLLLWQSWCRFLSAPNKVFTSGLHRNVVQVLHSV